MKSIATFTLIIGAIAMMLAAEKQPRTIEREVRHEPLTLPYYGLFGNLAYRVDGSSVTLFGQVVRPTLEQDAEARVKEIEGVERVVNEIEVLPLSPSDDRIRRAVYQAVYSKEHLRRYALSAVPPTHIIVKNGDVTLEDVVAGDGDKNMAGIAANQVSGVFSVTNHLQLDH